MSSLGASKLGGHTNTGLMLGEVCCKSDAGSAQAEIAGVGTETLIYLLFPKNTKITIHSSPMY